MGNTAFFISMTLTGVLALLLMRRSPRAVVILLTSLIIIDIFIVSKWFGLDQLQQRFEQMQEETVSLDIETNTLNRLDTTMHARKLQQEAIWTGTGAGSFFAVFPAYQGSQQPGFFQHAHNDYMEFLTDTGRIGFVMLGGIVLISLATAIGAMRKRRHPLMRGLAFASTMGILSLMIHSTTDFNLRIPANVALFMVILAFAFISYSMPIKKPK
jgi:O-antigen ligase